jgi:hypothetical protein
MKPLTKEHIIKNSKPHGMALSGIGEYKNARQYVETIGDYTLSIVGGCSGLYGDFKNTFEVALIDETNGEFVTGKYSSKGDDVLGYADIDDVNEIYFNIPRKY